ncbi:engulfment and cell motility protein 3 isoform X2 [Physeter macrocephalus]|uniref:Engulfment and cell motility protein 3 isoform X2 n=1 Tax=Physeter macrocephalus TaxID=9755 RepID=A0A9W2WI27_PHYMC|nr:engulfment and cell motility protein 3 isoform X2 [Physeter catodon]
MNLMDASVQPLALGLLESVTLSSPALGQLVKSEVPLDRLLVHLQVMNQQLQTKAMALLTALLQGASAAERKVGVQPVAGYVGGGAGGHCAPQWACRMGAHGGAKSPESPSHPPQHMLDYLWQRNLRQFIYKNIIHSAAPLGDEMAHHLYVLQALTLGLLEPRMRTPLDPYSQEQREQLQALRQAAFELEGESLGAGLSADRRRSLCAREFRKLGFSNSNPAQDLERVPPGLLALDNMLYFSRHAPSAYSRFVLENSSREDKHECPFARSSIQLTVLLCELLHVGEPCSETAQDFSPMFFGQDQSFHELFCVSIQLLNKTWKEMRATQEDFDKLGVAPGHASGAGAAGPHAGPEAQFPGAVPNQGEHAHIRGGPAPAADGAAASGRHTGPSHSGAAGEAEARAHGPDPPAAFAPPLRGDTLPQDQQPTAPGSLRGQWGWRAAGLGSGRVPLLTPSLFPFLPTDKLWFCCLSPNHKLLQYGDVEEGVGPPAPESLPEQLPVADIRALLTGKDCPHVREKGSGKQNKDVCELAFSVSYDHGEEEAYLNFIAPSKRECFQSLVTGHHHLGKNLLTSCLLSRPSNLLNTNYPTAFSNRKPI